MKPPLAPFLFGPRRSLASGGEVYGKSRPHGFSLVEVVLALGICSFVLIAVMGLMAVALQSSKQAVQLTQSGKIVQSVSSHLLQAGYTNLTSLSSDPTWSYDYEGIDRGVANSGAGQEHYTMTATPNVGVQLPGATGPNTNIMSFKLVTKTLDGSTVTNVVSVADTGY